MLDKKFIRQSFKKNIEFKEKWKNDLKVKV